MAYPLKYPRGCQSGKKYELSLFGVVTRNVLEIFRGGKFVYSSGSEGCGIDPRLCFLPLDVVFLVSVFCLGRDLGQESSGSMAPSSSYVYLGSFGDNTSCPSTYFSFS